MITAILMTTDTETKILKYNTESEEEACKFIISEWIDGKIVWDWEDINKAFNKNWLEENGLEPLSSDYEKNYENGVRIISWCYYGKQESDDLTVSCFLIHSSK